tara:strand:- start:52285 stop:52572 length:288 start_codon:yes stop_codon:yes gene_type:complete
MRVGSSSSAPTVETTAAGGSVGLGLSRPGAGGGTEALFARKTGTGAGGGTEALFVRATALGTPGGTLVFGRNGGGWEFFVDRGEGGGCVGLLGRG